MRKYLSLFLIILSLVAVASNSFGQSTTPPPTRASSPGLQFGNSRLDTLECRYFQVALNLTTTQTAAVLQAVEARNSLLRLLNAQSLSATQRAGQLKPILSGFSGQLQKILTPAQQQQWALLSQNKLDSAISKCKSQHKPYSTLN